MTRKISYDFGDLLNENSLLTYLYETESVKYDRYAVFMCTCGGLTKCRIASVKKSYIRSCGCLRKGINTKHGLSSSPEYSSWLNMNHRCSLPSFTAYEYYGGRGITVCRRWPLRNPSGFENFLEDMGHIPEKGYTLDRLDCDKDYSPLNCKWSSKSEQSYNRRLHSNNKTGVTGVSWHFNRYVVSISKDGVDYYLGKYKCFEEAIVVRLKKEVELYGEIKKVNRKWGYLLKEED